MRVCMYGTLNVSRRQPYSLECHGGVMEMHYCALHNMTDVSCAQNWVSDSDGSRTVSRSEFHRAGSQWAKILCPYRFALQYEMTRLPCTAERKILRLAVTATGMHNRRGTLCLKKFPYFKCL